MFSVEAALSASFPEKDMKTMMVPNAETIEAMKEVERMKADPSIGKTYTDVDQMLADLKK